MVGVINDKPHFTFYDAVRLVQEKRENMETDVMIQNLRALAEKHKDDKVYTFETRWTDVCKDVANRLEEQEQKIAELTKAVNELK